MAGIDTSIYNALMVRPKSVADHLAEYDQRELQKQQLQQNALALKSGQMQMADRERAQQRQNALLGLTGSWKADTTDDQRATDLKNAGFFSEADALEKQFIARRETQSKVDKANFEAARDKLGLTLQVLGGAKDQSSYATGLQRLAQAGIDVSKEPQQFDPAYVAAANEQALTQAQRLEQLWKQKGYDLDVRKQGEAERHNKSSESAKWAEIGTSRERLNFEKNQPRGQVVETEGGYVLVDPKAGTSRPITGSDGSQLKGKAANRQLTEGQGKSTAFAMRAIEAENQLEGMPGYNPSLKDRAALALPFDIGRGAASDQSQKFDTAKRNFIASILRKETGAAVTKPEFEMYDKMYFPQVGDSPEVLSDKKRQRDLALEGLMAESGPGREIVNKNVQRKASGQPQPGASNDPLGIR